MVDPGSMYIYEVAREVGMKSTPLRELIQSWGVDWDVSHHMRRLDAAQIAEVHRRLAADAGTPSEVPGTSESPAAQQVEADRRPRKKDKMRKKGKAPGKVARDTVRRAAQAAEKAAKRLDKARSKRTKAEKKLEKADGKKARKKAKAALTRWTKAIKKRRAAFRAAKKKRRAAKSRA